MAILLAQSAGAQASTANIVQNTGSNVTANNLLIVFAQCVTGGSVAISPSVTVGGVAQKMTYIDSSPSPLISSGAMGAAWCCLASGTGAGVITWVNSAVATNLGYAEYSGLATDGFLDVHAARSQASSTSWSTATTLATTEASELVWAVLSCAGASTTSLTKEASFTNCFTPIVGTAGSFLAEYLVVSSTGTQVATATAGVAKVNGSVLTTFGTTPVDPMPATYTKGGQPNSNACYRM